MASDTSDYDEDVILPTSPLSQYMQEFESLEKDVLIESDDFPVLEKNNLMISLNIKNKLYYLGHIIFESCKLYLSFIYNIFVPCVIPFEYSELKCVLDVAKQSKVLISEDLSILLNYEYDDESNGEFKLSYSSVFQQCFQLFAFVLIFFILRSITITNIVTNEDILGLFSENSCVIYILLQVFLLIISISLYINLFIISVFIVAKLLELVLCKIFCHSIKKKLHTTGCILVMIRKCIRLIQEAELIARGFTSASVPGIVERLELSTGLPITAPQRQYPELRKCVFMWTQEMFTLYKKSTRNLIETKTFGPVLDFSSQSFAMLDLKEFGSLLKYDINFDSDLHELLKITDNLSISSLKTMYLLLELQVSEFYKYLYLIASFLISDDSLFYCKKKINFFHSLNFFINDLQNRDACLWKISCETHKYYRSIESISDAEDKIVEVPKSNTSHFEICVHNMTLHLKAALKRLTSLEEFIEGDKRNGKADSAGSVKKIHDVMKEVNSEIDAYLDYYERCNNEAQNILYGVKHPTSDPISENIVECDETVKNATAVHACDSDPIIEDEIFEAFATKASPENETFQDFVTEEQKQNAVVTSKLLHELKNVLIFKADEHRIREEKAMAKKMNELRMPAEANSTDVLMNSVTEIISAGSELPTELLPSNTLRASGFCISQNLAEEIDTTSNSSEVDSKEESECSDSDADEKYDQISTAKNSFAASIAALALQRQKQLGILNDACFSDSNDSGDEIIS